MRIDLHCLYRRRFKTRFEICKHEDGELSEIRAIRRHSAEIIIHSRPMNYVMIHHTRRVTHTEEGVTQRRGDTHREYPHSKKIKGAHTLCWRMWSKHKINILLQKLHWWQKKKKTKKIIQSSSPTTMQTKQNNLQISRGRERWMRKFIWWSEQNAEYWILLSATQERILADNVYAIITYQSMLKECVVQVVNKSGDENCSQDNLCLERTISNIQKHLGVCENSDIPRNSWKNEIKIADVELRPNFIRESQLLERGITRTRSACKRLTQGQQSEWVGREENS